MANLLVYFSLALFLTGCAELTPTRPETLNPGRSIVKIQALSGKGKQNLGSGVVIAPNLIATNCHVTRSAKQALLIKEDKLYPVLAQAALPDRDVCILQTEALNLPTATIAETESVTIGDDITLSGYPYALHLRTMKGKVIGLHPYDQHQIIEINTGFNHGASGGGVFNNAGELIGLMTFMGPEQGVMHFYVIPAVWLTECAERKFEQLHTFYERSFWERGDFKKNQANNH